MSKAVCFVLCVVALSFNSVHAVTEEEKTAFREAIQPIIAECSQEHGVSKDDIKAAKEGSNIDGINDCFLGCMFTKTGVLNSEGKFDMTTGLSKLKQYVKSEEDLAKFEEVGKKCAKVNDEPVFGGEANCVIAKRLMTCFLENKAELPL